MTDRSANYEQGSLSLTATVAMGTGVMIGAGIFALTGQVAELAGGLFPLAFIIAAMVSGFSAYSYIKVASAYPSAGGIAMILHKAYGDSTITGAASLLMALSMVINESLVARTFGAYTLRLFPGDAADAWVPVLAVGLIVLAFVVNVAGNKVIGTVSNISAAIKIGGLLVFAAIAVAASGVDLQIQPWPPAGDPTTSTFVGAIALAILAFKGFTTITNSGDEVIEPEKNIGRAIVISLAICLVVYMAVCFAVASSLTLGELIEARDYSLAEAARPAIGGYGTTFTVVIAMIATASGLVASVFAVSRMLAMLTDMKLIPHSHFGMPGDIQKHTLVYTVVIAAVLAALFDLSRIASMGAIFYLVMDMAIHWGVFRHLRDDVGASAPVLVTAIALDALALVAFVFVKGGSDPLIVGVSLGGIATVFAFERFFLRRVRDKGADDRGDTHTHGMDHDA
ncbi:APC family permease [Microvenator marinus]|uniref:APC family permease n=1 Tax=Microvenator marinus TaxID=2600177 RepID=A0A5B8XSY9_9DELT|nr:APC family permease [Microvenator marinus]QED26756.1 APC family permease [Microvenator marinus]